MKASAIASPFSDCVAGLRTVESPWLLLPHALVLFSGLAIAASLLLMASKLDGTLALEWWVVLLPVIAALAITYIVFTIAVTVWIVVAVRLCSGMEVSEREFRLDILFRTAKICFLGHGYMSLLIVTMGLLLVKLHTWTTLPAVYPLLPLIVLGLVYIFLAVMFKQPEVDAEWSAFVGTTLLAQSIMLVVKLDHFRHNTRLAWATVFCPSWLAYVLLLVFCVLAPLEPLDHWRKVFRQEEASYPQPSARLSESTSLVQKNRHLKLRATIMKVLGISLWVVGFSLSQVLLTLQLDGLAEVSWFVIVLPALMGLVLLLIFVTGLVSEYFTGIARLLLDTFGVVPLAVDAEQESETTPRA